MEYNKDYILYVENLSKKYPGFQLNVSFALPKGCIMGLVGTNGAGKSTTLRLLLGLARPDSGRSIVLGTEDLNRTPALREEIGVVFDECSFPEVLTPAQLGKVLAKVHPHWEAEEYRRLLERLELPAGKVVKEFSRGMKMKLAIAAAMSHRPRLLLLDEPTSGLDPIVRGQVLELFQEFIQDEERGILLSSHITSDLERIADYITFIDHGRVLLTDEKDTLVEVYGIIKGPAARMGEIAPGDALGLTATGHGFEGLVRNKEAMARKYPEFILDRADLDEIILFLTREETKGGK